MFVVGARIGTLTNVDFDPDRIRHLIREAVTLRDLLPPAGRDEPAASNMSTVTPAMFTALTDGL